MERDFDCRRSIERAPVEGYAITLQLKLIPSAKMDIYFWIIISIISCVFAYTLQHTTIGAKVHIVLASCSGAVAIKYFLQLLRLKRDLKALLAKHPEFEIHDNKIE